MNNDHLPDIYSFMNFRLYLEEYRRCRKKYDNGFTHAFICHKLGQTNSRSYFSDVLKGRKLVTSPFIDFFIDLLELDEHEARYFRALVYYNQAANGKDKEFYFERVLQFNRSRKKLIEKNAYSFYKHWYHSTILSLLEFYDFDGNYSAIARKLLPGITVKEATDSIRLLEKLGLIQKNEDGFFKPTEKMITTGECVKNQIVRQYQLKCLDLGKLAVLSEDDEPRSTSTFTIGVSEDGFQRIMTCMQQFKSELSSIVKTDKKCSQRVYQVSMQVFPKTR